MTSFQDLYDRYAKDVFRFAVYLSGDRTLADDITSETFARVWTAPRAVRIGTARAYLFAIARNLYLDHCRRRRTVVPAGDDLRDTMPAPDEALESRDELAAVLAALHRLPEVDRAALLMRALHEAPYEDIASALGLSVAAAKVKVHRARIRLGEVRNARRATPAVEEP
jgi:RNA polymerase sigma-70 factor (ECF subfamily)